MNVEQHIEILGHKMIVNPDDKIISYRLRKGIIYEKASVKAIMANVKEGQTFVNIGANIGYFTLILSHIVGQKGRGYSFEPDPTNFSYLKRNIELNGYENIVLEQRAVGDIAGTTYLYLNNKGNQGDHRTWKGEENREKTIINITTLNNYFRGIDLKVDFIKMDIQGAEALALKGMSDILSVNKDIKILMEFWPWGLIGCGSDLIEMIQNLKDQGFHFYDILKEGKLKEIYKDELKGYSGRYISHKNIWLEREN
jgi:FkbM family methyltransferase